MQTSPTPPATPSRRELLAAVAPYQTPSLRLALWQFSTSFAGFLALNAAMYVLLQVSVWLALALAIPAAGMLMRVFIIQHDCGHGSFFRARWGNDLIGTVCSALTFTPYAFWRRQHANHHASFNNLDRRDTGVDIYSTCATVEEYAALPPARRLLYRVTRHPLLTQFILPPILFILLYRIPFDTPRNWSRERLSVYATDAGLLLILGALMLWLGIWPVLAVQLPIIGLASIAGVWLFSVQHRFEAAQWAHQPEWNAIDASLNGSSYLKLPAILRWFTGNIGFHHVHHLSARVPNYRLKQCHDERPELQTATTLGLWEALLAPCYALWDEERGRMARFSDALRFRPKR